MLNLGGFLERLNAMAQPPPFNQRYRAFPVACANKTPAALEGIEQGDKIILPASALDHLAQLKVTYPMMFEITNEQTKLQSHCGVLEFSSEEGIAYLPLWMMDNLGLESGSLLAVRNVTLSKGTFVQLQPHETKFTELANPRVVLEKALRSFSCLTTGDTIAIKHGGVTYRLDIVEVKPGRAISIYETDVNVDFKEPKDYKEYTKKHAAAAAAAAAKAPDAKQQTAVSGAAVASAAAAKGGKSATGADDAGGGWGADSRDAISHNSSSNGSASAAAGSGAAPSLARPASASSGSNYFAQFGEGHRLKPAKPGTATAGAGAGAGASASAAGAAAGAGATGAAGAGDRKAPPDRKLPAAAFATSSTAAGAGTAAASSPSGDKVVTRSGGYEYTYQKVGDKTKLLKRKTLNTSAGFTAFGGAGNKLK